MFNKIFSRNQSLKLIVSLAFIFCFSSSLLGQDVEPRRWTPIPIGIHVVGAGYAHTNGNLFFDPVLQITDAKVELNSIVAVYVQPFRIGNKLGRIDANIPYVFAKWDGLLEGQPASVSRSGIADPRLRISMNIIGPGVLNPKEMKEYYQTHPVNTTLGVSLAIRFPLGQYFDDKLLNIGSNRFMFRPQVGMVHSWGKWSYELTVSAFLFTNNNDFYINQTKKTDPIYAIQTHLIRAFSPKYWASISAAYGTGGVSIVNNNSLGDERANFLGSAAFGMRIFKTQSLKFTYLRTEAVDNVGVDTNSLIFGWSVIF